MATEQRAAAAQDRQAQSDKAIGPLGLCVGQRASRSQTVTAEQIELYAQVTGDRNPLHFDPDFAARTRFGRLVAQGGIAAGMLNTLVAMDLPGPGTVFMSQSLKYLAPSYIGGWSAAEHWGLTEQIFRSTFVVTGGRARRSDLSVGGAEFHVVRVRPHRVESVPLIWRGKERVRVSEPERTIADALANPNWLGGIRTLIDALTELRRSDRWKPERLLTELESVDIGSAFKRLGYIAETLHLVDPGFLRALLDRRTTGLTKLDPAIAARGRLSKRWGVWVNASVGPRETT